MDKSPDAFRTISEVASWLDTPTHVLRFWESRFTQVKPVKRAGGRRYYRPRDMELLGGIKVLLHSDGMTIRGVQKLLREEGVKHVAAMSPPIDVTNVIDMEIGDAPIELDAIAEESTNVLPLNTDKIQTKKKQRAKDAAEAKTTKKTNPPETGPRGDVPVESEQPAEKYQSYMAAKMQAGGKKPVPVLEIDVPDDPVETDEAPALGILGVAAALRRAASSEPARKTSPEVFGELYNRLSNLRDRMDSSNNADQTD